MEDHKRFELKSMQVVQDDLSYLRRQFEKLIDTVKDDPRAHSDNFEFVTNVVLYEMECVFKNIKDVKDVHARTMIARCSNAVLRLSKLTDVRTSKEDLKSLYSMSRTVHNVTHSILLQQDIAEQIQGSLLSMMAKAPDDGSNFKN